ncbi:MAG: WhiB family transcriptional regulator, partial [Nocardioidaceae bacterium]
RVGITGSRNQGWTEHAACVGRAWVFDLAAAHYGYRPRANADQAVAAAKAICSDCPVAAQCLAWALDVGDSHAVLGGTTPAQRQQMRREAAS